VATNTSILTTESEKNRQGVLSPYLSWKSIDITLNPKQLRKANGNVLLFLLFRNKVSLKMCIHGAVK
jgi:hypothetical protein